MRIMGDGDGDVGGFGEVSGPIFFRKKKHKWNMEKDSLGIKSGQLELPEVKVLMGKNMYTCGIFQCHV